MENFNYRSVNFKPCDLVGEHINTCVDSNGFLTLKEGKTVGCFTAYLKVEEFKTMIISWNANVGDGVLEIQIAAQETDGGYHVLPYCVWTERKFASFSYAKDKKSGLKLDTDTIFVREGISLSGMLRVSLTLERKGDASPVVRSFTLTSPQFSRKKEIKKYPIAANIPVPMRSQLAPENGKDGGVMCSATTAAMAMEYFGANLTTAEVGERDYDVNYEGYGNWVFSTAVASAFGVNAYVDIYDEAMTKYALSRGVPLGCSTYLTSSGHLVLLVGYETVDGVDFYIINDPNVDPEKAVCRRMTCEEYHSKWFRKSMNGEGVVYVFNG